jgi:hypothetical protein
LTRGESNVEVDDEGKIRELMAITGSNYDDAKKTLEKFGNDLQLAGQAFLGSSQTM